MQMTQEQVEEWSNGRDQYVADKEEETLRCKQWNYCAVSAFMMM